MAGERGSAAVTLQPCEEQALRRRIESATAGKTNLTDEQLVDLLCSAFPQSYSRRDRKLLTERVAKITPLPCRRADAVDEPTQKRRKIDETGSASRENSASSSSFSSDDSSENDDSSDSGDDSSGSDGVGHDGREMNENASGGLRDASGNKRPMFSDLLGMRHVITQLKMEAIVPLHQLDLLRHLGVKSIPRILFHGPPGFGKTTLARAVGNEAGLPFYEISAAELVSGVPGAPEENIRELFSKAYMRAPSVVFIDKIDALTSKSEGLQKEIEKRIVRQLMACMDEPYRLIKPVNQDADSESCNSRPVYVLVIGATNRLDALDPAFRRRFDREIFIGAPCFYGRSQILSTLTHNFKVEDGLELAKLGACTLGFAAGDLVALVKEASMLAVNRIMYKRMHEAYLKHRVGLFEDYYRKPFPHEEMKNVSITMADFVEAGRKMVRPSSKVEEFSITPNAKWDDVGGLESLKLVFQRYIVQRIKFPERYKVAPFPIY